jgi:NAD(P)-dependent dehydrogenase (short-subunit alcohol dehydrogenase family)
VAPEAFLEGRTALVTGSSRNLGAVIAERLAARGGTIAVTYRSSEAPARDLVERLREATGRPHVAVGGDLADGSQVRELVAAAQEGLGGRIDVLVHNAGPFSMTPFTELGEREWDEVWDVNVKAAHLAAQLVAPAMRETGWGRIVLLSAGSAYLRNHSIYGLAKQAVSFLAEELAVELGPDVTVNAVAPGQIAESADDIAEYDPGFVARATAHTPAGRLVSRAEVADLVALLCAPAFAMVTGATLPVDGGWRLQRF